MSKIVELDKYKCVVYIDYDIPFDFKEERESVYDTLVNNLATELNERKIGYKICAEYTTLSTINIFKTNTITISEDDWKNNVMESIEKLTKVVVVDKEKFGEEVNKDYTLDYTLEFSFVDSYSVYY